MNRLPLHYTPLLAVLLSGCVSLPEDGAEDPRGAQVPAEASDTAPSAAPSDLEPEVVFDVLVGEIAGRRRDFTTAFVHLHRAARRSHDPEIAERAARLGIYAPEVPLALEAAELWVSLQPDNIQARQLTLLHLVRQGEAEGAFEQMQAIVSISESRGEDGFLQAMAALNRGERRQLSIRLMQRLAAVHPAEPRARYASALLALMVKETVVALREATRLVVEFPDFSRGYPLLARVLVAQGNRPAARSQLEAGLERHPSDKLILSTYARLLVEDGDYALAYRQFERLYEVEPEDHATLFSMGAVAVQLGRFDQARAHFRALIDQGHRTSDAAYYMGRIEEETGHPGAAERWYGEVREGDFLLDARIRRFGLMVDRGDLESVREEIRQWRLSEPDLSARLYLVEAEVMAAALPPERVLSIYGEALKAHPGDADILYARALYAASVDRIEILEADLRQVLSNDPDNADALNALGYTLADKNRRLDEAQGYIRRALELKPEEPAILDSMGWVLYRLGRPDEALGYLRKAWERLRDGEIAAHLGEVLWVTGKEDEARRVWKEAIEADPESRVLREAMKRFLE